MANPTPEYELQRIADNLESIITTLSKVNDTIDALRWEIKRDAEIRQELLRQANDIRRRGG